MTGIVASNHAVLENFFCVLGDSHDQDTLFVLPTTFLSSHLRFTCCWAIHSADSLTLSVAFFSSPDFWYLLPRRAITLFYQLLWLSPSQQVNSLVVYLVRHYYLPAELYNLKIL